MSIWKGFAWFIGAFVAVMFLEEFIFNAFVKAFILAFIVGFLGGTRE